MRSILAIPVYLPSIPYSDPNIARFIDGYSIGFAGYICFGKIKSDGRIACGSKIAQIIRSWIGKVAGSLGCRLTKDKIVDSASSSWAFGSCGSFVIK